MRIVATEKNIDELFVGVMIDCHDLGLVHAVPGWKCRRCRWTIGTFGLPPAHDCPAAGGDAATSDDAAPSTA